MANTFKTILEKSEEISSGLLLGLMAILVLTQVVNRYFFQYPIDWLEELARYVFIWSTYLGFSVVTAEDKHLEVRFIREVISPSKRKGLIIFSYAVTIIFCIYSAYYSWGMAHEMYEFGETSPALEISMAYIYGAIPVGMGLMGVNSVFKLYSIIMTPAKGVACEAN